MTASGELTPAERSLNARIAAHASWAATPDRKARTAPARAAQLKRFERQVDPDGVMTPQARKAAAESARREHMLRMSKAAAAARKKKRAP